LDEATTEGTVLRNKLLQSIGFIAALIAFMMLWQERDAPPPTPPPAATPAPNQQQTAARLADLKFLTDKIAEHYVYAQEREIDARAIYDAYAGGVLRVEDDFGWTLYLEPVLGELYDHHAFLNMNTDESPRLVPSGADMWPEYVNGVATITSVRAESSAAKAGLRPGMTVTMLNQIPMAEAVRARMPRALKTSNEQARDYALQVALAGVRKQPRVVTACVRTACKDYDLGDPELPNPPSPITARMLDGKIGYLRIENSLGDTDTVAAFDAAVVGLKGMRALILDLRNTPGGGNTDVAEPILGRFIRERTNYQLVETPGRGKWERYADPRGPTISVPLYVLVDRWTGSMGEGMAVGFDGMGRGIVIGTRMAGLKGAIEDFPLPNSKIVAKFPTEKLFHLGGTPREDWTPPILVDLSKSNAADPILATALARAAKHRPGSRH
jgi:carboxyl-terminal processing protease